MIGLSNNKQFGIFVTLFPVERTHACEQRPTDPWRNGETSPRESPTQSIKPAGRELSLWDLRLPPNAGTSGGGLAHYFPRTVATGALSENPEPKLFDEFRRPAEKPAFFGTHPPEGYGRAKVDQWIKKNVPKAKQSEVKTTFSALKAECDSLVVGGKPNLEAILTDWGLTSQILNKASVDSQIRLLAAVQHIKKLACWRHKQRRSYQWGWAAVGFSWIQTDISCFLTENLPTAAAEGCQWIPYILKFSVPFNWHVQQRLMWIQSQWTMTHFY